MRVVEKEYATQYLSMMNLIATTANINTVLKKHPLAGCEIQTSGWDNTT